MNIALVTIIEWPDSDPLDGARDWLEEIISSGLVWSNDDRGAYIDDTDRLVDVIKIMGVKTAL